MDGNRQVAKCRILKRFGENFVKNVGGDCDDGVDGFQIRFFRGVGFFCRGNVYETCKVSFSLFAVFSVKVVFS